MYKGLIWYIYGFLNSFGKLGRKKDSVFNNKFPKSYYAQMRTFVQK